MSYRYGNRDQIELFPPCIDDYVSPSDPVRAYDAFVDAIDLAALGIIEDRDKVGNSQYDPRTMLKLFVYGYSYSADRSSRKLERSLHHNLSFIWLLGGLKPDHKTISNFRKNNKFALEQVLKQSARMCLKMGLIDGNTLFFDGTKVRANASMTHTWNKDRCKKTLEKVDKRIEEILTESDVIDEQETETQSLVRLKDELENKKNLREKVTALLTEIEKDQRKSINTTDKDCVSTHSTHGSYAGYNAQIATDGKNGLIASADVVSTSNDQGLLSSQIQHSTDTLEKQCETAVSDAGYSDLEDISKIDESIDVLVPIQRQNDEKFVYDKASDTYTCPEGNLLQRYTTDNKDKRHRYKLCDSKKCRQCNRFGECTKCKTGRTISRSFHEETASRLQQRFSDESAQQKYALRAQKVEHPFGHMRRTLGIGSFLLRGIECVKAEFSLYATAFNITRMITLMGGVTGFISTLRVLR